MLPVGIYPYMNLEDLNLDYILKKLMRLETDVRDFVEMNAIKYADPIQWNITTQYEKNTIVIDPATGSAYLSVRPVPAGIDISRTEYWMEVFNLSALIQDAVRNLTEHDAGISTVATFASAPGEWVMWKDILYIATSQITPGDAYTIGGNIVRLTVEEAIKEIALLIDQNAEAIAAEAETRAQADDIINDNVAPVETGTTATAARNVGDLVIVGGVLYEVTAPIAAGGAYVPGTNVTTTTIAKLLGSAALTYYENVAEMIADTALKAGTVAMTAGYYSENDGGGATYAIRETSTRVSETLDNGLVAELQYLDALNVLQLGAHGDGQADDTAAFLLALSSSDVVIVPRGENKTYRINGNLTIGMLQTLRSDYAAPMAPYPKLRFETGGVVITGRNAAISGVAIETTSEYDAITIGEQGGASLPGIRISDLYIYNSKWAIRPIVNAWQLEIDHVRIAGSVNGIFLDGCGPCVSIRNCYFDRCTANLLFVRDSRAFIQNSNFGFIDSSLVTITNSTIEFVDCNFETDETKSREMIRVNGREIKFSTCKFGMSGVSGASVMTFSNDLWSCIFENCRYAYQGDSAGEGYKPPFALGPYILATYPGAIVIGKGCPTISNTIETPYDSAIPVVLDEFKNGVIRFKSTNIDTTKLTAGTQLYSLTINKPCYYDGTNVRRSDTDAVVV